MPAPKNGQAGTAIPPDAPAAAHEADNADPGEVEKVKAKQRQDKTGKYGAAKMKPYKKGPEKKHWIEIELVDEDNHPVPGEPYAIKLPDGETVAEGTLDDKGFARVDGIDPGSCEVTFPRLDKSGWKGL